MENLISWLEASRPDVVLLQEIKCQDEQFPQALLEDLGYNIAVFGQKTYNGVAILSKRPLEDIQRGIPREKGREESRYLEAVTGNVRVASIYVPNGQSVGTEKFYEKLDFFKGLKTHVDHLLSYGEKIVLGGDYNVAPTDYDVYDPQKFQNKLLVSPAERAAFSDLIQAGLIDGLRQKFP